MMILPHHIYPVLLDSFGPQDWWPVDRYYHQKQKSDPRFEIMVGAILTQNTAWTNVEKALDNLKGQNVLSIQAIAHLEEKNLRTMIQPSGFFNQKARRLKLFSIHLETTYQGNLQKFFARGTQEIRNELLALQGIGPETADSILLYAGDHPVFVVDSYTKRICHRLPFHVVSTSYDDVQSFFDNHLQLAFRKTDRTSVYKEFHALLVKLAKQHCWKNKPECLRCPLTSLCKKFL